MKLLISTLLILVNTQSFAKEAQKVVHCKAWIQEKGEAPEIHEFTFKCDNYGDGSTIKSKSGRYTVEAFSEESCTPQLMIIDSKSNTFSTAVGLTEKNNGFAIFNNRVVATTSSEATISEGFGNPDKIDNKAWLACSYNKYLLDEATF